MRKLALFAGSFSSAVFLWRYGLWMAVLAGAIICAVGMLFGLCRRIRVGTRLGILLAGLLVGLVWCALFSNLTLGPWERRHQERDVTLQVRIDDRGSLNDRGQLMVDVRFTDPATGRSVNGLAYLPDTVQVRPGDVLEAKGSLYLADRLDGREITYFSSRGDFLRFYVSEVREIARPERPSPRYWPMLVGERIETRLSEVFSAEAAPLATALVLGEKSGLSDYFLSMSRRAGVAHVIVISGMHISFLAGLAAVFLGRHNRLCVGLTLVLLCFFALVAGGTPSAWRAVMLCAAGLVAPLFKRENDPPTSLLTALMVLLAVNPFSAASVSLQLSFAAVAGIELLTPALMKAWTPKRPREGRWYQILWWKVRAFLVGGLAVSLGAVLFTTPLSACYFGTVSLIGVPTNLLTLWAVSGAFVIAVIAASVSVVLPAAAAVVALPGEALLRYLLWVIPKLGNLPFAAVTMTGVYYVVGLAVIYALVCLNLFWPGKKRLRVPLVCCCGLALLCVVFTRMEFVMGDMTVAVLDVGQGQSVCIRSGGKTILVDCGGDGSVNAGDAAADYLADQGIGRLDLLVLTHYHTDHTNGVAELLRRMEVAQVAVPDVERNDPVRQAVLARAEEEGAEVLYITEHTTFPMGEEGGLRVYAPLGGGGSNEMGLSVLASAGDYDVLITGDMNAEVETRLVKYGALPDIELLVVGHHGSNTSTGEPLLRAVRPEWAVISVGRYNSYGHPAPEVLGRLAEYQATVYRTDLSGTVVIHTKGA